MIQFQPKYFKMKSIMIVLRIRNALPVSFLFLLINFYVSAQTIPHLEKRGSATQLIVNGQPFLVLAGELHNSTATSPAYLKPIWKKLTDMHLNTVLAAITWELTEPEKGKFDFSLVDSVIADARKNNMRLSL